jgi:lipid-A-disaccharide synthase
MIESAENKASVINDSKCVLAKSGTNNIEIALYGKPFIVAYKVNFFSWLYIKSLINIKYASLLNIIANKEIVPEFLQYNCSPKLMSKALYELITNKDLAEKQILATNQVIESLKISGSNSCYRLIVDKVSSKAYYLSPTRS